MKVAWDFIFFSPALAENPQLLSVTLATFAFYAKIKIKRHKNSGSTTTIQRHQRRRRNVWTSSIWRFTCSPSSLEALKSGGGENATFVPLSPLGLFALQKDDKWRKYFSISKDWEQSNVRIEGVSMQPERDNHKKTLTPPLPACRWHSSKLQNH